MQIIKIQVIDITILLKKEGGDKLASPITISQPKSIYVKNEKESTYLLKWSYPDVSNQVYYEVLYRRKTSSDWSTFGKINSKDTTFDLRKIREVIIEDFEEIYYKLLCYYDGSYSDGSREMATIQSDVYSIMFNSGYHATRNVQLSSKIERYPLFDSINIDIESTNILTATGIKQLPLVNLSHPLQGKTKIQTESGVKAFASDTANFLPSNIYGNKYAERYQKRYESVYAHTNYTNYGYRYNTLYTYKVNTGYKITGYSYYSYITGYGN